MGELGDVIGGIGEQRKEMLTDPSTSRTTSDRVIRGWRPPFRCEALAAISSYLPPPAWFGWPGDTVGVGGILAAGFVGVADGLLALGHDLQSLFPTLFWSGLGRGGSYDLENEFLGRVVLFRELSDDLVHDDVVIIYGFRNTHLALTNFFGLASIATRYFTVAIPLPRFVSLT